MDDIVEAILLKLHSYSKKKCGDLFFYIDDHLDQWNIELGELFLDDVVAQVGYLMIKRARLNQTSHDTDILFREDDATMEAKQLAAVYSEFDKIHAEAQTLPVDTLHVITTPNTPTLLATSWEKTLNRIDVVYNRVKKN